MSNECTADIVTLPSTAQAPANWLVCENGVDTVEYAVSVLTYLNWHEMMRGAIPPDDEQERIDHGRYLLGRMVIDALNHAARQLTPRRE